MFTRVLVPTDFSPSADAAIAQVRERFPDAAILAEAEAWRADLIVMGTHGRTGLAHFLNGSVAEQVVRHARRSVLPAHEPSDYRRGRAKRPLSGTRSG